MSDDQTTPNDAGLDPDALRRAIAGDGRRAGALVLHNLDGDAEGVLTVMREANDIGRVPQLIYSMADMFTALQPRIDSEDGRRILRDGIIKCAQLEQQ